MSVTYSMSPIIQSMRPALLATAVVASALIGVAGCNDAPAVDRDRAEAQLKVLGILYGKYVAANGGRAPASEKQLLAFLESKRPSWEKLVKSPAELLASPYDQQPLIVMYGDDFGAGAGGSMWVAHEKEGVDGRRTVVSARGAVEQIEQQQLGEYFPESKG